MKTINVIFIVFLLMITPLGYLYGAKKNITKELIIFINENESGESIIEIKKEKIIGQIKVVSSKPKPKKFRSATEYNFNENYISRYDNSNYKYDDDFLNKF